LQRLGPNSEHRGPEIHGSLILTFDQRSKLTYLESTLLGGWRGRVFEWFIFVPGV